MNVIINKYSIFKLKSYNSERDGGYILVTFLLAAAPKGEFPLTTLQDNGGSTHKPQLASCGTGWFLGQY